MDLRIEVKETDEGILVEYHGDREKIVAGMSLLLESMEKSAEGIITEILLLLDDCMGDGEDGT